MNRACPRLSLILVILLSAGAVLRAADGAATAEAIFDRGETLEYSLSWMGITGGKATLSVVADGAGHLLIHSLAESSPSFNRIYKVRDEIQSKVEKETFSTVHFRKFLQEKKRTKDVTTTFDYEKGFATRRDKQIPIQKPLFDPLSTVYYIRKLDLVPGRKYTATIIADSKVYSPEIVVVKRETLRTEAGTFRTVMVEPKLKHGSLFREGDSRLFIWYTDDARKIPVRIRSELSFGSIVASLRAIRAGAPAGTSGQR